MRLDETRWVYGGGLTPEWRWVGRLRLGQALAGVKKALGALKTAPAPVRKAGYDKGLKLFLSAKGPARDRLAVHPCLDYWLYLFDKHFGLPVSEPDWHLHYGAFQGFAAALALETGRPFETEARLDPSGGFYLYGTRYYTDRPGRVKVGRKAAAAAGLKELVEVQPGLVVDDRSWLTTHGVTMHGLKRVDEAEARRFAAPIKRALDEMAELDPPLRDELVDMTRVVVPLENPMSFGSVSSSYMNLRGAICLSHAEDALLQAETMIHEYCHQKMNQLLAVDPLLLPGQSGQVFYSPWRPDARRLRGLALGAHAFLNVGRYLSRALARKEYPEAEAIEVMVNVSRRALQVETALRSLVGYAELTEFGRRFALRMWRGVMELHHAVAHYPPALLAEQRAAAEEHKRKHSLFDTGLHKQEDFKDTLRRAAFLTPKSDDEVPA